MSATSWTNALGTGNWDTNGNWTNNAPVNGSTVSIPPTATAGDILLGLDQSAVVIASLHKMPGSRCNIGQSGTPLVIGADRIYHEGYVNTGVGKIWLDAGHAGGSYGFLSCVIRTGSGDAAWLDGRVWRLVVQRGTVATGDNFGDWGATANGEVFITQVNNVNDSHVTLSGQNGDGLDSVTMRSGVCTSTQTINELVGSVNIAGGQYTQDSNANLVRRVTITSGAFVGLGTVNILEPTVLGGVLDLSQDGSPKRIIGRLQVLAPGTFIANTDTVVTAPTDVPLGGSVRGVLMEITG